MIDIILMTITLTAAIFVVLSIMGDVLSNCKNGFMAQFLRCLFLISMVVLTAIGSIWAIHHFFETNSVVLQLIGTGSGLFTLWALWHTIINFNNGEVMYLKDIFFGRYTKSGEITVDKLVIECRDMNIITTILVMYRLNENRLQKYTETGINPYEYAHNIAKSIASSRISDIFCKYDADYIMKNKQKLNDELRNQKTFASKVSLDIKVTNIIITEINYSEEMRKAFEIITVGDEILEKAAKVLIRARGYNPDVSYDHEDNHGITQQEWDALWRETTDFAKEAIGKVIRETHDYRVFESLRKLRF